MLVTQNERQKVMSKGRGTAESLEKIGEVTEESRSVLTGACWMFSLCVFTVLL